MLSSPKHGWATINIGSRSDQCSYLDDVPFLLLDAFLMALQHETPVAIEFDAEGYDYTLVFSTGVIHIISGNEEDSSYRLFTGDVSYKTLAQELISDIQNNIDGWTYWLSYQDSNPEQLCARRKHLIAKCVMIEHLL